MARKKRLSQKKREKVVNSIVSLAEGVEEETQTIRKKWRDNHEMFEHGTKFYDKQSWQSSFSINKLGASIRAAQARLRRILIANSDWYDLDPVNPDDPIAADLALPLKKLLNYYLEASNFKRYASTFILQTLVSMGCMYVGWKKRTIRNPEWVSKNAEAMRRRMAEQAAKSGLVDNVDVSEPLSEDEMEERVNRAIQALQEDLQAAPTEAEDEDIPPYIQIGGLDLHIPIAENVGWDTGVNYLEDSELQYYRTTMRVHQLKQWAKLGLFDKKAVDALIEERAHKSDRSYLIDRTYRAKFHQSSKIDSQEVELLVYFGPLISEDKVEEECIACVIGNESHLLAYDDYPFWEPSDQKGPLVMAAAREIPHRAVGAGIGDTAVNLQRALDANYTLINDSMRFGVVGVTAVNTHAIVDKTFLEEGIEPGAILETRENPKDVVQHINLTSNIENQAKPVQLAIEQGIEDLTGVSALLTGGNNLRSRTTAAEVQARQSGSEGQVDSVALDIEQQFLGPVLQKVFARVLQFGIQEIRRNPEIRNVLTEDEIARLSTLSVEDRVNLLYNFYKFKVKGFSHQDDKVQRMQRMNEVLQIANSGGPMSEIFPWTDFLKRYLRENDMDDISEKIDVNTEVALLQSENQLLLANQQVEPVEGQDHQRHMQSHQTASVGNMTPAMQQHLQMHQELMQLEQQLQQQQQQLAQAGAAPQGSPEEQIQ